MFKSLKFNDDIISQQIQEKQRWALFQHLDLVIWTFMEAPENTQDSQTPMMN